MQNYSIIVLGSVPFFHKWINFPFRKINGKNLGKNTFSQSALGTETNQEENTARKLFLMYFKFSKK